MSPATGQTKHRKVNLCNCAIYWFTDVMQWSLCKNLSHSSTYKPLWQYSILLWGILKMSCWKSLVWPIRNKYAPNRMPVDTPGLHEISRLHKRSENSQMASIKLGIKLGMTTNLCPTKIKRINHYKSWYQSSSWSDWDISSFLKLV